MANLGLLGTMSRYGQGQPQQARAYGAPGPGTYSGPVQVGPQPQGRFGMLGTQIQNAGVNQAGGQVNQAAFASRGGVQAPVYSGPNSVQRAQQGPSLEQLQAEMARRNVGAQLNADPRNSALAGYMMGQ